MDEKGHQTLPELDEPSANREPIRDDFFTWRFQTRDTSFQQNSGLPPLLHLVTHEIPRRIRTQKVSQDLEAQEAMPKLPQSHPLPLPNDVRVHCHPPLSSNVNVSTHGSSTTIAPPKFGKGKHQVAWPLPRPPSEI
ncbi:hypothetical protein Vadar_021806 [Vaccinium darrowii]|nr:hypothetical protein Vadar_021806 [Vaccinium darrowii]